MVEEYFKDYYLNNKYIGSKYFGKQKDREIFGFMGRKNETFNDDFKLDNGRLIRIGTIYITELQLICGKK